MNRTEKICTMKARGLITEQEFHAELLRMQAEKRITSHLFDVIEYFHIWNGTTEEAEVRITAELSYLGFTHLVFNYAEDRSFGLVYTEQGISFHFPIRQSH